MLSTFLFRKLFKIVSSYLDNQQESMVVPQMTRLHTVSHQIDLPLLWIYSFFVYHPHRIQSIVLLTTRPIHSQLNHK